MPDVFGHGSTVKWSERQDFHLRPPGPKPGALKTELRSDKIDSERLTRTPEWRNAPPKTLGHGVAVRFGKWRSR